MTAAPTWFRSFLDKVSERLPPELRKTPSIRQRALVAIGLLHSLVVTLIVTLVFLWVNQVPGKYFLSGVTLTLMGMMWWPHQLLMREHAISRAGNILSGILTLGTGLIIAVSGGASSPAILELLFGPIVAVVLSGPIVGFRWGVATFCMYLWFAFGPGLGFPLPVYIVLPDSDWMFLVSISTVLFFVIWSAYLSDQARQTAIRGEKQAMTHLDSVREQERQAQLIAARITAESEAKSAFLAHMSHELRTPLNIILGYIELIRERVEDADYEGLEKDVGHASGAAGHLLELINDVLDLSRLDATTPPTLEPVDIPTFTSGVIQSFDLVARQAKI
ncbi:MAG: sensor histidine kinase, partial [Nannocystaceae bacterium]